MEPTSDSQGNWEGRKRLLSRLDGWLETPMVVLAFVWLLLLILDLIYGLSPAGQIASDTIWILFIVEFTIRFAVAPDKPGFLLSNWITAAALLLPAFRILRPLRVLRGFRGAGVLRVVSSLNRGMSALGETMGRRGFGYVTALSLLVALAGAAGMYAFERNSESGGFASYGDALWWTAMTLTTLGSSYTPATVEARVLTFLLALYAFSVFGYVAAALASFFVERDAASTTASTAGKEDFEVLMDEIRSLRREVAGGRLL